MINISSGHAVKPLQLNSKARLKQYYDFKKIVKGEKTVHFFPANATRNTVKNNYVTNPFPGSEVRNLVSVGIDVNVAALATAAGIDPIRIINSLKFASLKFTLNSDNVQVLEVPITEYIDFAGSGVSGFGAAEGKALTVSSKGLIRIPDPFRIGQNQTFDVQLNFNDVDGLPTEAQWTEAGYAPLELGIRLLISEEEGR